MKKILLVDDEPNILMSLEYSLRKNAYEVFIARDGQEALDILREEVPDMVILDIMMPNVDGDAVMGYIRKTPVLSHCKVMFLSAKNRESDIEKGLAPGADAYMTKPFPIRKLLAKIASLLQQAP